MHKQFSLQSINSQRLWSFPPTPSPPKAAEVSQASTILLSTHNLWALCNPQQEDPSLSPKQYTCLNHLESKQIQFPLHFIYANRNHPGEAEITPPGTDGDKAGSTPRNRSAWVLCRETSIRRNPLTSSADAMRSFLKLGNQSIWSQKMTCLLRDHWSADRLDGNGFTTPTYNGYPTQFSSVKYVPFGEGCVSYIPNRSLVLCCANKGDCGCSWKHQDDDTPLCRCGSGVHQPAHRSFLNPGTSVPVWAN